MCKRFFVNELLSAKPVRLDGGEAHHLIHVLRIEVGHLVTLFDGDGFEADAEVVDIKKGVVELEIVELRATKHRTGIQTGPGGGGSQGRSIRMVD